MASYLQGRNNAATATDYRSAWMFVFPVTTKSQFFQSLIRHRKRVSRSIDLIGLPLFIVRAGCVFQFDQGFDIGGNSLFPGSTKLHITAYTLARMQVCDIWHGIKKQNGQNIHNLFSLPIFFTFCMLIRSQLKTGSSP